MFDDNGSFLLALFEFFIFLAWFMSLWWILGDLFRSKDLGAFAKTLWVLFIIVLPFIGLLAYLVVRGRGMNDRTLEVHKEIQQRQEEYIKSVVGGSAGSSPAGEITSAKALLDSGAITQQEFDLIKARALGPDLAQ